MPVRMMASVRVSSVPGVSTEKAIMPSASSEEIKGSGLPFTPTVFPPAERVNSASESRMES
ncbi:hypothetical protein [Desulfatiferula olefinivorans]